MAHDVFISYSSDDKKVADAACAKLEMLGHRCWIAPRDILPGKGWGEAIVEAIGEARIFVLIFSGSANGSPQVLREIERAVSKGLTVIPFRIEDVPPSKSLEYFISAPHWLDALTPPLDRHLDHLADTVERLLGRTDSGRPAAASTVPPAPPRSEPAAPSTPSRRWVVGAAAGAGAVALGAAALVLLRRDRQPRQIGRENGAGKAQAGGAQPTTLLDFSRVRTDVAPDRRVAAAPLLHEAAVPIRVSEVQPAGSRLLFVRASDEYEGNAIRPTLSDVVLTLQVPEVVPSSFAFEFERPLDEFAFTVPALFPATESGIIFPAFRATAVGPAGRMLDQVGRALRRSFRPVPAETITLRPPPGRRIAKVVFNSNPQQIAAFRALVIEGLSYR